MKRIRAAAVPAVTLVLTIAAARPVFTQKLLGDGIKELSDQIVSSASEQQKRRIAVLAFRELSGEQTILGTYLSESLTTQLFRAKGFEILERTMLDKVIGEMKLASTGLVDPATAARIGKLAGVDAIVTGSVTDMQSSVAVNCRLIDVATGRVFGAAESRIVKDDDLRAILWKKTPGVSTPSGPSAARQQSASAAGLQFTVLECARAANFIECQFNVSARQDQDVRVGCDESTGTRAFDGRGRPLKCGQAMLASQRTAGVWGSEVTLVAGIPARLTLTFEGATSESNSISRLDIAFAFKMGGWSAVQFREVGVAVR